MLYGLSVMAAERGTGRVQRFPVAGYQPHQGAVSQRRQEDTPPPPRKTVLRASGEDVPRPKRPKTGKAGRTEAISWRSRRPAQWIGRGAEMTDQSTIKCSACKAGAGEEEIFGLTFERHGGSTFRISLCRDCTSLILDLLVAMRSAPAPPHIPATIKLESCPHGRVHSRTVAMATGRPKNYIYTQTDRDKTHILYKRD